jgi:hypothetical protein
MPWRWGLQIVVLFSESMAVSCRVFQATSEFDPALI